VVDARQDRMGVGVAADAHSFPVQQPDLARRHHQRACSGRRQLRGQRLPLGRGPILERCQQAVDGLTALGRGTDR
jgi:hypothetical protein